MPESTSRFGWPDAFLVLLAFAGIATLRVIDGGVLPRIRSDIAVGLANTDASLPDVVRLLFEPRAAATAIGVLLLLLLSGVVLRLLLWRRLGRALLLSAGFVGPLFYALVAHGAARAGEIAFGPGLVACPCPPAVPGALVAEDARCGCDSKRRLRVELVRKSAAAFDDDLRMRYDYAADERHIVGFDVEVMGRRPHKTHRCSFDPPCNPAQFEKCTPRCERLQ